MMTISDNHAGMWERASSGDADWVGRIRNMLISAYSD